MEKLLIINVLSPDTYEDCRIKGSINVPVDKIEEYAKKLDKNTPIVVYCASYSCPASSRAWHKLKNMGFTNIKAYEGGMAEWKQKEYPLEGSCALEYLERKEEPEERNIETITAEVLKELMENRN